MKKILLVQGVVSILLPAFLPGTLRPVAAQSAIDTAALRQQLESIYERDQKIRKGVDSVAFIRYIDSTNLVMMEDIIAKYGWPGRSLAGAKGNRACFLVIQHADSARQVKYLPLLMQSVEQGESLAMDLALLQDRVLMRQGKKQIYGSQVVFDSHGNPALYPIDDEKNVDIRRAGAGLQPIAEYAIRFGIDYKPPAE